MLRISAVSFQYIRRHIYILIYIYIYIYIIVLSRIREICKPHSLRRRSPTPTATHLDLATSDYTTHSVSVPFHNKHSRSPPPPLKTKRSKPYRTRSKSLTKGILIFPPQKKPSSLQTAKIICSLYDQNVMSSPPVSHHTACVIFFHQLPPLTSRVLSRSTRRLSRSTYLLSSPVLLGWLRIFSLSALSARLLSLR